MHALDELRELEYRCPCGCYECETHGEHEVKECRNLEHAEV